MPNPFFPANPVPPNNFVGRERQLRAAFDIIHQRSHLAIWGGPGVGKTSYLKKIACPQTWKDYGMDQSGSLMVLLSCLELYPFTPSKFWRRILTNLHDQLQNQPELKEQIRLLLNSQTVTNDSLGQAIIGIHGQNKHLVLLVDDFGEALKANHNYTDIDIETFLAQFRGLATHGAAGCFSVIVSSTKRLNDLLPALRPGASPWYNHYMYGSLTPFNQAELEQLLKVFPLKFREAIQDITGGHPSLIQIAGFLLYPYLQEQQLDITKFTQEFERETRHIFSTMWQTCNNQQQILLMLILLLDLNGSLDGEKKFELKGIGRVLSQNERKLTELEEQGIVTATSKEGEKFYRFTSLVMRRFVIQEIWNTSADEIRNREKLFLNLLSHGQLREVNRAITWLGTYRDTIQQLLEWGGRMGGII